MTTLSASDKEVQRKEEEHSNRACSGLKHRLQRTYKGPREDSAVTHRKQTVKTYSHANTLPQHRHSDKLALQVFGVAKSRSRRLEFQD